MRDWKTVARVALGLALIVGLAFALALSGSCSTAQICGVTPPQPGEVHPVLYVFADENNPQVHEFSPAAVASVPAAGDMCISQPVTIQDPILSIYCANGALSWNGTPDAPNGITYRQAPIFGGQCQVIDQYTGVTSVRPIYALFCWRQTNGAPDYCGPS